MVTCKLFAQLGNQCFMLSAAISHALRLNTNYAFPRLTTAPRIWRTYFTHLPLLKPGQSTEHFYKEPGPSFSPIPDEQDITIEGYFQCERYWYDKKEELAKIMGFEYKPDDHVAVHVRRGDYLKYPTQFPVLPIEYYGTAVFRMIDLGYTKFIVFSDDPLWCEKTLLPHFGPNWTINFSIAKQKDPLSAMREMYNASAFIVANSTFSLYPALLRSDNPMVIAPEEQRWFGPAAKHLDSPDRLPERFIKI